MVVVQTMKGSSRSRMTKAYGKILILAFGLAVIAVMVVHKLRERRILDLIVDEKDQQLNTLQLLLQREVDFNKEMSRKIDDLKPRLHMLRSQKMELNGRVLELQSTVASLKDEIRVVESALVVKKGENKMLRDKITEILKEKDAQIKQMKQLLNTTGGEQILTQFEEVDLKRVKHQSNGEETGGGGVARVVKDDDKQRKQKDEQQGHISRAGMKLEVAYKSKHGLGFRGDDPKHHVLSYTKGKKSRAIARNKGPKHPTALRSRKVSEGKAGERFVAENSTEVSVSKQQNHDDTESMNRGNQSALENLTVDKWEDTNSINADAIGVEKDSEASHKPGIVVVQHDLSENTENSDASHKVEVEDVQDQVISAFESAYSSKESQIVEAHDDLISHSETENGGSNAQESDNSSSDSESERDQHNPISHSENDEEGHTNAEEVHDASHETEMDPEHATTEEENEDYNA